MALPPSSLLGVRIGELVYRRHVDLGLDFLALNTKDDRSFVFCAKELPLGQYETYEIELLEQAGPFAGAVERRGVDVVISDVATFLREEWQEPAPPGTPSVGNNPWINCWGPLGAAPQSARATGNVRVITAAYMLCFERTTQRALVYIADFPLLVGYTAEDREIEKFLSACSPA